MLDPDTISTLVAAVLMVAPGTTDDLLENYSLNTVQSYETMEKCQFYADQFNLTGIVIYWPENQTETTSIAYAWCRGIWSDGELE